MIKQSIKGMSKKDLLLAKAENKVYSFMMAEDQIRGSFLHGTHMIREMRLNHHLGILETLVLGHAYIGAALMASNMKEGGRIAFKIDCEGPIKGLSVEANSFGEVRGYLKQNPIPVEKALESFDLSPFFGTGLLEVIHYPEYAKQPFSGHVNLIYKNIASDLANYYRSSEQTPTYFNLSIKFDSSGKVLGAGGLLLQGLPNADDALLAKLEDQLQGIDSIGAEIAKGVKSEPYILDTFQIYEPKILSNKRVEFYCHCKPETIGGVIGNMSSDSQKDLMENGPFPVEIICHNCNTAYHFDQEEIKQIVENRKRS